VRGRERYRVLFELSDQLRGKFRHYQTISTDVVDRFLGGGSAPDCLQFLILHTKRFAGCWQRIPFIRGDILDDVTGVDVDDGKVPVGRLAQELRHATGADIGGLLQ